ncbi:hypothetical protein IT398_02940, partial [Candidatus Nomurabacteria bacterium]|nr:hypothetical protein [Candidatus Nomurabacteria bacterium]
SSAWVPLGGASGGGGAGAGTIDYLAKWATGTTLGNSQIFDNGTNVGVGTASPGSRLDVVGGGIRVGNSAAEGYAEVKPVVSGGASDTGLALSTMWGTLQERMRITNQGNVGIGTTSPNGRLSIGNNVANGFLDNYNEYQQILYDAGTAGASHGIGVKNSTMVFNSGAGGFSFDRAGNTTEMAITTFGDVGIGTVSPAAKLDVIGRVKANTLKLEVATVAPSSCSFSLADQGMIFMYQNIASGKNTPCVCALISGVASWSPMISGGVCP